jgi:hypothetical protein
MSGEALISPFAKKEPNRCARLIGAIEKFVKDGAELGTIVAGQASSRAVYLVPPRFTLRGVPDAAALVVIDMPSRTLRILDVRSIYGADDEIAWPKLVSLSQTAL